MKRHWIALFLVPVFAFAAGCPFESKVPLGTPSAGSLDTQIYGLWFVDAGETNDSAQVLVLPFDEAEYYVEVVERGGRSHYRAFPISIGERRILQINELEAGPAVDGYSFGRYSVTPDGGLSLRFIGEKIVPASLRSDARGLADFIAAHFDDPALDDEESILLRRQPRGGNPMEKEQH